MLNFTKKVLFEPLLHFLILGALAYLYFDYFQAGQTAQTKPLINIENYELQNFQKDSHIQNKRLALELLTYQKILLQEAYSLELYKEDQHIHQLLLSKMEYLFKSDKQFDEPTEEQLKEFYNAHLVDYSKLESFDLYMISLNKNIDPIFIKKLAVISNIIPIAKEFKALTPQLLEKNFGRYTAFKLSTLAQGFWSEPIEGNMFFITNKKALKPYPFEEIEDIVYKNYKQTFTIKNEQEEYVKLYSKYSVQEQK
jgi:hypothetical protein